MKKVKSKGMSKSKMVAVGAALGGAAYYFLGPKGKHHQKSAKKWTLDAKKKIEKEITGKLKKAKSMSESLYENIVDEVVEPYVVKGATSKEVGAFTNALKKDWKNIVQASKKQAGK
jgi:hypothetical protein